MPEDEQRRELLQHTSTIVAAHVANNAVPADDLPRLIVTVHQTLATLGPVEPALKPRPAVPIKQSVTPDYIICLEDGKKQKNTETPSYDSAQHEPQRISRALGTAPRLPTRLTKLRQTAQCARKENRPRSKAGNKKESTPQSLTVGDGAPNSETA